MSMLPKEFDDLEPFAAKWCIAAEGDRYAKRLASTYDELQALYEAVTPRADAAMTYCDKYPLDALAPDARNLLHLLYSWITTSFAVECWSQPVVPDSGAAYLDCLVAPIP